MTRHPHCPRATAPTRCGRSLAALGLAVVLLGTGCSAAPPVSPSAAGSSVPSAQRTPAEGMGLRDLGLTNGPDDFRLPREVAVASRIDQPNVVTLTFETSDGQGERLAQWLGANLEGLGYTIDADRNGSLLFHSEGWRGAYTTPTPGETATLAALTLRRLG